MIMFINTELIYTFLCFGRKMLAEYHSIQNFVYVKGARCSSVVRAFGYGAMGHRINPSWGGPIELFLVP